MDKGNVLTTRSSSHDDHETFGFAPSCYPCNAGEVNGVSALEPGCDAESSCLVLMPALVFVVLEGS